LIVLAFQQLAQGAARAPQRLAGLVGIVGGAVGVPFGIVAGQAWECEREVDLSRYQQQKTGALFAAAGMAGAAAAGSAPEPWRRLGECLGEAYQVADDLLDAVADAEEIGKPTGQDALHNRPNAVALLGLECAMQRLEQFATAAADAIPPCPGAEPMRALILQEVRRLMPRQLAVQAA
jgi:geranylgeranyl diphosphate synthase type II